MSWWRNSTLLSILLLVGLLVVQVNIAESDDRIDLSDKLTFRASDLEFSPATVKPVVSIDNLVIRIPVFLLVVETKSMDLMRIPFSTSPNHVSKWRKLQTGLIFSLMVLRI